MKVFKYIFLAAIALILFFLLIGYFSSPESVKKNAQISELEKICSQSLADSAPQDRARLREVCEIAKKRLESSSDVSVCDDLVNQKKRALKLNNLDGAKMFEDEYKAKCEVVK